MGINGTDGVLVFDELQSSPISIDDIEKAALKAQSNFRPANQIFIPPQLMSYFTIGNFSINPEYEGLKWAETARLTIRERKVANLHILLLKLRVLSKVEENDLNSIVDDSIKRLRSAFWARYPRNKV
jgi:hypothetical protein